MGPVELHIEDQWRDILADAGLDSFDALMRSERGRCVSYHTRCQVYRIELTGGKVIFLKRDVFTLTMLKDTFFDVIRLRRPEPPCIKELIALGDVRGAGVSAPEPIAWGQRRRGGLPYQGVLMTSLLQGTELSVLLVTNSDEDLRRSAMRSVGETARRICEAGLSWWDMLPKHFFISDGGVGVLDLARMEKTSHALRTCAPKQVCRFIAVVRERGATDADVEAFLEGFGRREILGL